MKLCFTDFIRYWIKCVQFVKDEKETDNVKKRRNTKRIT